jgi:hypothetical protein
MELNFQNYPTDKPEPHALATGERMDLRIISKYDVDNCNNNPFGKGYGDDIHWSENLQKGIGMTCCFMSNGSLAKPALLMELA